MSCQMVVLKEAALGDFYNCFYPESWRLRLLVNSLKQSQINFKLQNLSQHYVGQCGVKIIH